MAGDIDFPKFQIKGAQIVYKLFQKAASQMVAGNCGTNLEKWCINDLQTSYGNPFLKGYKGFSGNICVNVNNIAAHGIPNNYEFRPGDVVTLDVVIDLMGWKTDLAWTYPIQPSNDSCLSLIKAAWQASLLPLCTQDNHPPGKICATMLDQLMAKSNFTLCRNFAGHQINKKLHDEPIHYSPEICVFPLSQYNSAKVFCWEPIISAGNGKVSEDSNCQWYTQDGTSTAQFEHMYLYGNDQVKIIYPEILKYRNKGTDGLPANPPW